MNGVSCLLRPHRLVSFTSYVLLTMIWLVSHKYVETLGYSEYTCGIVPHFSLSLSLLFSWPPTSL